MGKELGKGTWCTRREALRVLGGAGLAVAFPSIVPSSVFGKNAPSGRIAVGMVGMGRQAAVCQSQAVSVLR